LRAPRHLRLQSVTPAGDGAARANGHDARRRATAAATSEIKCELQRLELVVEMIDTLETERDAIVHDEASTHLNAKKIPNLHKLKAIGLEFAVVLVGEIFH
jgi:hypothetical protein